jgi:hypothetical protein
VGGCDRVVSHGREFCPLCWRKLPVSVQSVIDGRHPNITKQVKKNTMKVAKRVLRES